MEEGLHPSFERQEYSASLGGKRVSEVWSASHLVTGKQNQHGGFRGRWETSGSGQSIVSISPQCLKKSKKSERVGIWNSTEGAKARQEIRLRPHHGFWAKIWTLWIWRLEGLKSLGQEANVKQPLHTGMFCICNCVFTQSSHSFEHSSMCQSLFLTGWEVKIL